MTLPYPGCRIFSSTIRSNSAKVISCPVFNPVYFNTPASYRSTFSADSAAATLIMRAGAADLIRRSDQLQGCRSIFPQKPFLHLRHMLSEPFTVSLPFEKIQAHAVVRTDPVSCRYFHIRCILYSCPFSFRALDSLLLSVSASAIFTRSGMMKGITHQPSTVARPTAPEFCAYTTMNHTVPIA